MHVMAIELADKSPRFAKGLTHTQAKAVWNALFAISCRLVNRASRNKMAIVGYSSGAL